MDYQRILDYIYRTPAFIPWLGIKVLEIKEGYCRGELAVRDELSNPMGIMHGGCIFSLADTIGGVAATTRDMDKQLVTLNSSINYLRPVVDTEKIIAEAHEIKYGSTIAVYQVDIINDDGELIANVSLSYYKKVK